MRNVSKPLEIPAELSDNDAKAKFSAILTRKKVTKNDCEIYRQDKIKEALFDL